MSLEINIFSFEIIICPLEIGYNLLRNRHMFFRNEFFVETHTTFGIERCPERREASTYECADVRLHIRMYLLLFFRDSVQFQMSCEFPQRIHFERTYDDFARDYIRFLKDI